MPVDQDSNPFSRRQRFNQARREIERDPTVKRVSPELRSDLGHRLAEACIAEEIEINFGTTRFRNADAETEQLQRYWLQANTQMLKDKLSDRILEKVAIEITPDVLAIIRQSRAETDPERREAILDKLYE